ncbi:MAG: hypothetical protein DHS20C14_06730 [Phycisphaeraceae bacterium]|nr:MAG: hypothetical protein DHS20C14_06730 [Phycisphaeraceae bacterium]
MIDETEGDPELRELKIEEMRAGAEVFRMARELRGAHDQGEPAIAEARAGVESALNHQYEARLAVARAELERVRDRLGRMELDVARMGDRRGEEVDRMMERMLASPSRERSREPRERAAPPDRP